MAKLTTAQRNALPSAEFAEPGARKYPINDASHARNALARVSQHGTPAEKKAIRGKVSRKYPKIQAGGKKADRKMGPKTSAISDRMLGGGSKQDYYADNY